MSKKTKTPPENNEATFASGGIVNYCRIAPDGSEFIVPLSAMNDPIRLKQSESFDPDKINESDQGFEIIMPESTGNFIPTVQDDFGDVQEVQFGKMPLDEVFAKQPPKKRIRAIEKARATKKRRKANKLAKKARKK